jgi:5'-3' exonuclease
MDHILLVDFSNFVNVCWWPAVQAQEADPKYDAKLVLRTNIEHKMSTMDAAMDGLHNYRLVFVEDRPPKAKYEIYPLYKANRAPKDFDPRPLAKEYMADKGLFLWGEDAEADDTIATLVRRCLDPYHYKTVTVVSSDKDLWQLIRPGVRIWSPSTGKFVDEAAILKSFGVTNPQQIPLVKALWGDAGDNVPNAVPRMQKQLLPIIQASDGSLIDFWMNHFGYNLTPRCEELLQKGLEQVRINYKLVKLDENVIIDGAPWGPSIL